MTPETKSTSSWTISFPNLHPNLIEKIDKVLSVMAFIGYPMRVCQGVRTTSYQQSLYAKGRTTPGPIVTNADGVHLMSNHQPKADGFGRAVDCCFLGPNPFSETKPWRLYGEVGKVLGLRWGGDWTNLVDKPHLELL